MGGILTDAEGGALGPLLLASQRRRVEVSVDFVAGSCRDPQPGAPE
ncbi:MAG: hypothetical protein ACK5QW_10040 [Cyanobacteriota bacterium]